MRARICVSAIVMLMLMMMLMLLMVLVLILAIILMLMLVIMLMLVLYMLLTIIVFYVLDNFKNHIRNTVLKIQKFYKNSNSVFFAIPLMLNANVKR